MLTKKMKEMFKYAVRVGASIEVVYILPEFYKELEKEYNNRNIKYNISSK